MARKVAKAGAAKGGSCRGFSGPGDRCHLAVSKRQKHHLATDAASKRAKGGSWRGLCDRHGQERGKSRCGKGWKLQGGFSGPGDRCHLAVSKQHRIRNTIWQQTRPGKCQRAPSKRHTNTIWQQTGPGGWKLERLRRQAWPGMWQKQAWQRWKLQAADAVGNRRGQATANVAHLR